MLSSIKTQYALVWLDKELPVKVQALAAEVGNEQPGDFISPNDLSIYNCDFLLVTFMSEETWDIIIKVLATALNKYFYIIYFFNYRPPSLFHLYVLHFKHF